MTAKSTTALPHSSESTEAPLSSAIGPSPQVVEEFGIAFPVWMPAAVDSLSSPCVVSDRNRVTAPTAPLFVVPSGGPTSPTPVVFSGAAEASFDLAQVTILPHADPTRQLANPYDRRGVAPTNVQKQRREKRNARPATKKQKSSSSTTLAIDDDDSVSEEEEGDSEVDTRTSPQHSPGFLPDDGAFARRYSSSGGSILQYAVMTYKNEVVENEYVAFAVFSNRRVAIGFCSLAFFFSTVGELLYVDVKLSAVVRALFVVVTVMWGGIAVWMFRLLKQAAIIGNDPLLMDVRYVVPTGAGAIGLNEAKVAAPLNAAPSAGGGLSRIHPSMDLASSMTVGSQPAAVAYPTPPPEHQVGAGGVPSGTFAATPPSERNPLQPPWSTQTSFSVDENVAATHAQNQSRRRSSGNSLPITTSANNDALFQRDMTSGTSSARTPQATAAAQTSGTDESSFVEAAGQPSVDVILDSQLHAHLNRNVMLVKTTEGLSKRLIQEQQSRDQREDPQESASRRPLPSFRLMIDGLKDDMNPLGEGRQQDEFSRSAAKHTALSASSTTFSSRVKLESLPILSTTLPGRVQLRENARLHETLSIVILLGTFLFGIVMFSGKGECDYPSWSPDEALRSCRAAMQTDAVFLVFLIANTIMAPVRVHIYAPVVTVLSVTYFACRYLPFNIDVVPVYFWGSVVVFGAEVLVCILSTIFRERSGRLDFQLHVLRHARNVEAAHVRLESERILATKAPLAALRQLCNRQQPTGKGAGSNGGVLWGWSERAIYCSVSIAGFKEWTYFRGPSEVVSLVQRLTDLYDGIRTMPTWQMQMPVPLTRVHLFGDEYGVLALVENNLSGTDFSASLVTAESEDAVVLHSGDDSEFVESLSQVLTFAILCHVEGQRTVLSLLESASEPLSQITGPSVGQLSDSRPKSKAPQPPSLGIRTCVVVGAGGGVLYGATKNVAVVGDVLDNARLLTDIQRCHFYQSQGSQSTTETHVGSLMCSEMAAKYLFGDNLVDAVAASGRQLPSAMLPREWPSRCREAFSSCRLPASDDGKRIVGDTGMTTQQQPLRQSLSGFPQHQVATQSVLAEMAAVDSHEFSVVPPLQQMPSPPAAELADTPPSTTHNASTTAAAAPLPPPLAVTAAVVRGTPMYAFLHDMTIADKSLRPVRSSINVQPVSSFGRAKVFATTPFVSVGGKQTVATSWWRLSVIVALPAAPPTGVSGQEVPSVGVVEQSSAVPPPSARPKTVHSIQNPDSLSSAGSTSPPAMRRSGRAPSRAPSALRSGDAFSCRDGSLAPPPTAATTAERTAKMIVEKADTLFLPAFKEPTTEAEYCERRSQHYTPHECIWSLTGSLLSFFGVIGALLLDDQRLIRFTEPMLWCMIGAVVSALMIGVTLHVNSINPRGLHILAAVVTSVCYCLAIGFAGPRTLVGDSQLVWLFVQMHWSLNRPLWAPWYILVLRDIILGTMQILRTVFLFGIRGPVYNFSIFVAGAVIVACVLYRVLLDMSQREAFALRYHLESLEKELQDEFKVLEATLKQMIPEGLVGQLVKRAKKRLDWGGRPRLHPAWSTSFCTVTEETPFLLIQVRPFVRGGIVTTQQSTCVVSSPSNGAGGGAASLCSAASLADAMDVVSVVQHVMRLTVEGHSATGKHRVHRKVQLVKADADTILLTAVRINDDRDDFDEQRADSMLWFAVLLARTLEREQKKRSSGSQRKQGPSGSNVGDWGLESEPGPVCSSACFRMVAGSGPLMGAVVGSSSSLTFEYFGSWINRAKSLLHSTDWGTVLATERVYELQRLCEVSSFEAVVGAGGLSSLENGDDAPAATAASSSKGNQAKAPPLPMHNMKVASGGYGMLRVVFVPWRSSTRIET